MLKDLRLIISTILIFTSTVICQSTIINNYTESDEIIANPERGFSVYRSSPVTGAYINGLKQYNVTVIQRIYSISQFTNSIFSNSFLNIVKSDMLAAREGGVKLVLRFSYTENQNGSDAPLNIILQQIDQLKSIFQENSDVILYVEAGFIGAWGEWYYSTNKLNNTRDRKTVLFALLDALPSDRCVVVRTPKYKRDIFEDENPILLSEAFNGSNKSRTGAHNDCFLASSTDFGTYVDNSIESDKNYLNKDNMFVPQGGETCNPSQFSGCNVAPVDLARMHWSILNRDYHPTVLDGWKSEGCFDEIHRNLGYRFVLLNSEITDTVKPGGTFRANISLVNRGYASPFNPRNFELILREVDTKVKYRLLTTEDVRYCFSGDSISVEITAGIKDNMLEGNYELLLHLADPETDLHDKAAYSIQLANENVWEDSTGFNYLNTVVNIDRNYESEKYDGELLFMKDSSESVTTSKIQIDGNFDDWATSAQLDLSPNIEELGDGINPSVDIEDIWVTDDEENIYISYSLSGGFDTKYFYHVFFDVDGDTSTGFHTDNSYAGIDLMIENDLMWKYIGVNKEWGWEPYGTFSSSIGVSNPKRIELSVSKTILNDLGAPNSIQLLFNVNNSDDNILDDYSPNEFLTKSFIYSYQITSIDNVKNEEIINDYKLSSYPNPFNNSINLQFNVNRNDVKSLEIYDILGRLVKSYHEEEIGSNSIKWNGKSNNGVSQSSGIYIVQLKTNKILLTNKVVLLK